jgi:hypothetical protein
MYSIQPIKRIFVVSHTLKMATAVVMLAFAATGVAQARGANFCSGGFASDYYHQAQAQAQHHCTMRYEWPQISDVAVNRLAFSFGRGVAIWES